MRRLGDIVERLVRLPRVDRLARSLALQCEPGATVLDLGCGDRSSLRDIAPGLRLVGIEGDAQALARAREQDTHDEYIHADLLRETDVVQQTAKGRSVQMVVLLHVIEHLPKRLGFDVLELAESLTERFVLVETPNRFLPQGPEYGNEGQRHLSGWFPHDLTGMGYEVMGTAGTRHLRGYAGQPKLGAPGGQSLDFLLARLLWIERFPRHAYSIAAWKDVRGVPARLPMT